MLTPCLTHFFVLTKADKKSSSEKWEGKTNQA